MDFALTTDQRMIQESARNFLAESASLEHLRTALDSVSGWDDTLWNGFARELGFSGLTIPEIYGGSGLGAVEMALVLEETGRALAAMPFFETAVLATQAILASADDAQKAKWLPRIASGELRATFAGTADRPRLANGRLTGQARFVSFAHAADLLLVATQDCSLLALAASQSGITIERAVTLDRTRPFATVRFDLDVPTEAILGIPSKAAAAIEHVLIVGAGLMASEQTGGAQFCLDSTVKYALQRIQFGRPIGSFQAVKHEMADMMVMIEASRSATLYAATAIAEDSDEQTEACHVAASWASDCFRHCSAQMIQLHGGIGFTWEHHAHLYFKRARSSSTWLGTPEQHREALAGIILKEPA